MTVVAQKRHMRKTVFRIIFPSVLMLSGNTACHADSVVISFEGGKTQTVTLDGSVNSITAVQYLPSGDQAGSAPVPVAPPAVKPAANIGDQQQQPPAKPMVKFKWAEPVIGQ